MSARQGDSGLTLVEVLVSLSLFALIGIAGFAIIDSVLTVRDRTEGRLERLGDVERALHLLRLDFEQAGSGALVFDGVAVSFSREDADRGDAVEIAYHADDGTLIRRVRPALSPPTFQRLLSGVEDARWRFYSKGAGWRDDWPVPGNGPAPLPDAVEIDLALDATSAMPGGRLRRVVRLPRGAIP